MENINAEIREQTCRFCNQYDDRATGCKVCDCDNQYGYAHFRCFYNFVQQTGRKRCEYCKKEWMVDKATWKRFTLQAKSVTCINRVREAASILFTLIVILAMILLWAYLIKFGYWVFTGRPDYLPFGRLELASIGWLQPTGGDALTGSIATIINILLAILIVHYKPRCYRCCCMQGVKRYATLPNAYPADPMDDYVSYKEEYELDTLASKSISRQSSKNISIENAVSLGALTDDDSSSDSLPSMNESHGKKPPAAVIVIQGKNEDKFDS